MLFRGGGVKLTALLNQNILGEIVPFSSFAKRVLDPELIDIYKSALETESVRNL